MKGASAVRERLCALGQVAVDRLLGASVNLRQWAARSLEASHFADLGLKVDLGNGLTCPLLARESWSSFTETFVHRALGSLFGAVPVPDTWVDLGCHYGFFSLFVEQARRQAGRPPGSARALLVDADPRAVPSVRTLIELNAFGPGVQALHRAVGDGDSVTLFERAGMGSSLFAFPRAAGQPVVVPTLRDEEVARFFPDGIDLVKVDVEGAETVFFSRHRALVERTRFVVVEWHSWAGGGDAGRSLVRSQWERSGLRHVATIEEPRVLLIDGRRFECGTEALARA
jgi:FkbM family methyltransferase